MGTPVVRMMVYKGWALLGIVILPKCPEHQYMDHPQFHRLFPSPVVCCGTCQ